MKNFQKSKLKKKFYVFSSLLILALLFTGIYSLILMGIISTGTAEVSHIWLPSVIIAEELNTKTSNFRILEISHVITKDEDAMRYYEDLLNEISVEIDEMFDDYELNYITSEMDNDLIAQARSMWNGYLILHKKMINFSKNGDATSAMNLMENQSSLLFNEVSVVFSNLVNFNKDGAEQSNKKSDNLNQTTSIILPVIFIIAIFVAVNFRTLIQEIEKTQMNLAEANEVAMLSSQAKSNFLANMSHEIRTPMNAISGMIDIVLRETTDKNIVEYAQNIKRACDSLLYIINDVLDFSKIESGKLDIIEDDYSLSDILNDVITIANSRLEHKNLMFITNFQSDLPEKLIGDETRVKQVMVNILNNAIKFTQDGYVSFDVRGTMGEGILKLEFSISDTGSGISQESMEKLFEEFERVDTTKNRNIEGTGLGLAISKRLAEMMGGEIRVESKLNVGTKFTVEVIQKYTEQTQIAKAKENKSILIFESRELYLHSIEKSCNQLDLTKVVSCSSQSELNEALLEHEFDYILTPVLYQHKVQEMLTKNNLTIQIVLLIESTETKIKHNYTTLSYPINCISISNLLNGTTHHNNVVQSYSNFIAPEAKVLIVDDNHVNLIVAQGLMKPYKFSIDTALNGQEAIDKIKANKYDLVFMDHMMPILDGIDATIIIRSTQGDYYTDLPIIALTANAIIGTKEMFIKEGMNDFLDKPIKLERLNDVLGKWLPKELQIIVDENDAEQVEVATPGKTRISIENIDCELGISRIGGDFDNYINILTLYHKDGVKHHSIIQEFFDNKEFESYKIEVHAIKSASASIGATELSNKASKLENACIAQDFEYVFQNNESFLADFKDLLENIDTTLQSFKKTEDDNKVKEDGTDSILSENLEKLKNALDDIDVNLCDELLDILLEYQWNDETTEDLTKTKELVSEYEYDEAIEIIEKMLQN